MTSTFRKSFFRDLKRLKKNQTVLDRVRGVIAAVEAADELGDVPHLSKLSGSDRFYRIRVGRYRVGFSFDGETVVFLRCMHRRDIYRYFP